MKQGIKHLVWAVGGALAGAALAILVTYGIAMLCVANSPNDPSAGSVAIVIIFFLPVGVIAGAVAGIRWSATNQKKRDVNMYPKLNK